MAQGGLAVPVGGALRWCPMAKGTTRSIASMASQVADFKSELAADFSSEWMADLRRNQHTGPSASSFHQRQFGHLNGTKSQTFARGHPRGRFISGNLLI